MEKDFASWHNIKQNLQTHHNLPTYNQREIWWCSIGVNLGHEEDGKGKVFSRPVLIIRKFNQHVFIGVPLSTKVKNSKFYYRINFHNREQSIMLTQIRLWDVKRLTSKMGRLSKNQFEEVRIAIKNML